MILGTYWYFGFPTGLYKYDYFKFRPGFGGHSNTLAELITTIETNDPKKLVDNLRSLVETYKEGHLLIHQDGGKLIIGTSDYHLFDYDFLFISEVEKILKRDNIKICDDCKLDNPTIIRLGNVDRSNRLILPKKNLLQIVGSELKKHNAENSSFRLDCNLELTIKEKFLDDLKVATKEENLQVLFYFENGYYEKVNLMLFFSNGRQGVNFGEKRFVNTTSFENRVAEIMQKHQVKSGHMGGHGHYPQSGPIIEMIVDKEFIV